MLTRSHKSPGSDSAEAQRQVRRSSRSTPENSQSPTQQTQISPQTSSKPKTSPTPTPGSSGAVAKSKASKGDKDETAVSLESTPPVAVAFESAPISIPSKSLDPRTKRVLSLRKSGTDAAVVSTSPQRIHDVAPSKQPQQTVSFVSKGNDLSRKRKKQESVAEAHNGGDGGEDDEDNDNDENEDENDEEENEEDEEGEEEEGGSSMESSSEVENDGSDAAGESSRMSPQTNHPQVKIKLRSNLLQSQISANGLESDSQNGNSLSSLKRIKMRLGANKKQADHDELNDGPADDAADAQNTKKFPKIIARRGAVAAQGPMSPPHAEAVGTTDSGSAQHAANSTSSTKKIIKARLGSSKASQEAADDGSAKRESLDNSAGDSARDDGLTPSQRKAGKLSRSEKNRTIMHEDGDPQSPPPADDSLETPSKRVRRTRALVDSTEKRQPIIRPTSGSKKPGDVTATPTDAIQTPKSKPKTRVTPVSRGKYSSADFENPDLVIDSEDSEDDSDDSDDSDNDDDKEDGDDSRSGRRLHASVGSNKSRFVKAKRSGGKKGSDADQGSSKKATNSEKNSDSDDFSDDDDSGNEKKTDKQGKRRDSSSSPKLARMTGPKPRCLPDLYRAVVRFGKRKDRHEIFQQPVTEEEAPMYFSIIDTPMDFETLSANVEKNMYPSFEKFKHDLFLIFKNAMKYNPSDTIYYREAKRLSKWVLKYISRMAERLDITSLPYVAEPKVKKPKEQPTPTQTPGSNRTGPRLDAFNSHSLGSRTDMPHGPDSTPSHMHHSHSTYPSSSHTPQYPMASPMSRYSHTASLSNDTPSARYPQSSSNIHSMAYAHQSHTGVGGSSQADSGHGTFAHPSGFSALRSPNISRTLDQSYSNEDPGSSLGYPRSVGSHPPRLSQNIFAHEMRSIFDPSGPDSLLSTLNKSSIQTSSDNPFRLFGQIYKQVAVEDRKDQSQTKPQPKENEQQNLTPEQSYLTKLYSLENEGFDMSFLAKIFPWFQPAHSSKTNTNDRKAIITRLKGQLKETPSEPPRVLNQSSMVDAILSQNAQLLYNLQALQIERATPTPSQNERVLYNAVQRTLETLACLTKPSTLASNLRDDADLRAKYHVLLNQPKPPELSAPTKDDPFARS